MSYVAEYTIPPATLPFGETLVERQAMRIEIERIVPTHEAAMPFFWVWGSEPAEFMEAANREPAVEETQLLESVGDGALFQAEWSPNAGLINGVKDLDATIIESEGTADNWRFEVRAQDKEAFVEFQHVFESQGVPINLIRLHDLAELVAADRQTLTPEQRETLISAYQEGYYEKPRKITQKKIGDRFGISHRAVSDRLRRGTRNLISATLLPSGDSS